MKLTSDVSLGEMELSQLEASGFKHCISEFSTRSDLCVTEVCRSCNCITILCACSAETRSKFGTYRCMLPSSSIKAMIGIRVCSHLNTELLPLLD